MTHNFILVNLDTDSISFCKENMEEFSAKEQEEYLQELNSLLPPKIRFEHDGYFPRVVILKAKNYILDDGKKVKIKGSALKATTKEVALQEFIQKVINLLLDNKREEVVNLYNQYVKEISNVQDIKRWVTKKTITEKILNPERINEQKILDAIDPGLVQEGDKLYFYFDKEGKLKQPELFNNDHDVDRLYEKLYKTALTFESLIPKEKFINYKLKRSKKELEILLHS